MCRDKMSKQSDDPSGTTKVMCTSAYPHICPSYMYQKFRKFV
jgi:hypothetical protein